MMKQAFMICAVAAAVFVSLPSAASAQPFFVGGGLGAGIRIEDINTQFKLEQQFGYHFSGRPEGFFLGVNTGESFGDGFVVFEIGGRIGGDIPIAETNDIDVLLSPSGVIGLAILAPNDRDADAFFNFQFDFDVKLRLLDDKFTLFVRAVGLDFFAGRGFAMRFDVIAGGFLNF